MLMLTRRLQVLIDDERLHRLEREAAHRKVPVSVLVRDPVDTAVRRHAAKRILAAHPMPVPDPDELRDELDALRGRRG